MRIIGGMHKGRLIESPKGTHTRPTQDRVREALFSMVEARLGNLAHATVLDAYAGSGALGLEALSRGASQVVLTEIDTSAARTLQANVAALDRDGRCRVIRGDVHSLARRGLLAGPFTLLLLDPPYRISKSEVRALIETLVGSGAVAEDALIVWEHGSGEPAQWPTGTTGIAEKRYGSTTVSLAEVTGGGDEEGA